MAFDDDYINKLEATQIALLSNIDKLLKRMGTLSMKQQLDLVQSLNLLDEMGKLGLNDALRTMQNGFNKQIDMALRKEGVPPPRAEIVAQLNLLRDTEMAGLMNELRSYSSNLKKELTRGILNNESFATISSRLEGTFGAGKAITGPQARTLVHDSFFKMERQSTMKAFEDKPQQKFIYVGPSDNVTRPECQQALGVGELTKAEIDSLGYVTFGDGGGWNCRHTWEAV